jgi:hypothetical protein
MRSCIDGLSKFFLLKCLYLVKNAYVLREIHRGICDLQIDFKAFATQVTKVGFLWSTILSDATTLAKRCDQYKKFA